MIRSIVILLFLAVALLLFVIAVRSKIVAKRDADEFNEALEAKKSEPRSGYSNFPDPVKPEAFGSKYGYLPVWVGFVPLVLGLIILAFASTAIVPAKQVGVVTEFGKPVGTESPGLVIKAPWQNVTNIDGTVITNEYKGDSCIYVRIGDGSRSCLTTTIRWRIVPEKADVIYGDYRSDDPTESFRKAVISTQFKSAAQAVLSKYNPVATLEVVDGTNAASAASLNFAPDYDQIAADLTSQMDKRLGTDPLASIEAITVSYVSLSDSTQKTLDDFIKAVGATRIAAQNKSTATEQAAANTTIQGSLGANSEAVNQSRCIDALNDAIESKYALPAGFNCTGGGGGVVIPSSK